MPRQFQGSLAPLQDLEAERVRPAPKSKFSEQAPQAPSKVRAKRISDGDALLPCVGVRNGLIAGAAIWLAILTILAGMAS
jgi:hypothetical protein